MPLLRWAVSVSLALGASAQTLTLEEYAPKSSLVTPQHPLTRSRFPFIDVHNHQRFATKEGLDKLVAAMDALNLRIMVNLSGGFGERLNSQIAVYRAHYPGRFAVFANLDFTGIDDLGYGARAAAQLEQDVKAGAAGLKLFKGFGMDLKDTRGQRIPLDDPRFDAAFQACARLKIPVLIHTADPQQFWEPWDRNNERWLELKEVPSRRRDPATNVPWSQLIAEQHNLFRRHRQTLFINAHLGWLGGDLARLGRLMDECPNMYTEIGAVLAELGRQPRFARQWFLRYQDRVMFGKDSWNPVEYHTYFRVLETADEYFPYYRRRHAFWSMYGLELPDAVLRKLYLENALRIIPGLDAAAFPR